MVFMSELCENDDRNNERDIGGKEKVILEKK